MDDLFAPCLAFTLAQEGGYVDDPHDPGGATNLDHTHGRAVFLDSLLSCSHDRVPSLQSFGDLDASRAASEPDRMRSRTSVTSPSTA